MHSQATSALLLDEDHEDQGQHAEDHGDDLLHRLPEGRLLQSTICEHHETCGKVNEGDEIRRQ